MADHDPPRRCSDGQKRHVGAGLARAQHEDGLPDPELGAALELRRVQGEGYPADALEARDAGLDVQTGTDSHGIAFPGVVLAAVFREVGEDMMIYAITTTTAAIVMVSRLCLQACDDATEVDVRP